MNRPPHVKARPGSTEAILRELVDAYAALPEGPAREVAWEAVIEHQAGMVIHFILTEITAGRLLRGPQYGPTPPFNHRRPH